MSDQHLVEGRDYLLLPKWAEGDYERFPAFVRDMAEQDTKVIVVNTVAAAQAASRIAPFIPVVMAGVNDPVGAGLIASLARPGGNITGSSNLVQDVTAKMVEIMRATIPRVSVMTALFNPANPSNRPLFEEARNQAVSLGVTVIPTEFRSAAELDTTFEEIKRGNPDALLLISDAAINEQRARVANLALRHRLPMISTIPEITDAGGFMAYGPSRLDIYRRVGAYVKKLLDGTKAADLPVEQPTRIELSLNLRTAKALGISIPDAILVRADRVID
jgi:putative ABC transport system substrate-binding protein